MITSAWRAPLPSPPIPRTTLPFPPPRPLHRPPTPRTDGVPGMHPLRMVALLKALAAHAASNGTQAVSNRLLAP